MISVIVYGRNDSHGYNLPKRAALSFNCIAEVLSDPDDEIVFVDCNTPDDMPTFPESIADTLTPRARELLRILRVRPEQYEKGKNGTKFKVLEPLCRNIAIRRTNPRNRWILNTNTDMVFVPLHGKSLSEVCAGLADGFYELPRFEIPEMLWESTDRKDPVGIIQAFARWGTRLHINEMVLNKPEILFDGPGDFQLALRAQMFAIHGMSEQMVLGWHVDSNLCKRLYLLNGKTLHLLDKVYAYHCDHTRLNTIYHNTKDSTSNDWVRFFNDVTTPLIPEQASTWGLAGEEIEELRLTDEPAARYIRIMESMLPGMAEPMLISALVGESWNHGLFYDNQHVLPYLADHLSVIPPGANIGYVGANPALVSLVAHFRREFGHTGKLFLDETLLRLGGGDPALISDPGCAFVPSDEVYSRSAILCFDLWLGNFTTAKNDAGYNAPVPSLPLARYAGALMYAYLGYARLEKARFDERKLASKKFLFLATQNTWFEPATSQLFNVVLTPYSSYVRHGLIRNDAFEKPWVPLPVHNLLHQDLNTRVRQLSDLIKAPIGDIDYLLAEQLIEDWSRMTLADVLESAHTAPFLGTDFLLQMVRLKQLDFAMSGQLEQSDQLKKIESVWETVLPRLASEPSITPVRARAAGTPLRRILVDGLTFYNRDSMDRGIGHYARHHLIALAKAAPEIEFVLTSPHEQPPQSAGELFTLPNVQYRTTGECDAADFDLYHIPDPMTPAKGMRNPMESFPELPLSAVFYDLIPLRLYFGAFQPAEKRDYLDRLLALRTRQAQLLAISEFTRRDALRSRLLPAENIATIHAGLNAAPNHQIPRPPSDSEVLKRFGIKKSFFLHVGSVDNHKNFNAVVMALGAVRKSADCQLVVVGRKQGTLEQIAGAVQRLGLDEIVFTDFISREDLECLYRLAAGLLFVSHYEGFGFPVLEGMANGCPVICSNATSLPEVAGDAALMFPPQDHAGMAKGMLRLLNDRKLRETMRTKGRAQAAKFTWAMVAASTISVWRAMMASPRAGTPSRASGPVPVPGPKPERADVAPIREPSPSRVTRDLIWLAPWQNPSGYCSEALAFAHSLEGLVNLHLVDVAMTRSQAFVDGLPDHSRKLLRDRLVTTIDVTDQICLFHVPGSAFAVQPTAAINIGRTMFETDRLPPDWVTKCNQMAEVWVPSQFNLETFAQSGVERDKLHVIPETVDPREFNPSETAPLDLPNRAGFNFLAIFEWSLRKGWDVLIAAYLREFSAADDVCLHLRVYLPNQPDGDPTPRIRSLIQHHATTLDLGGKAWPRIEILARQVPAADLPRLYRAADCLVAPSRGEGWGRPQHEAMVMGVPVIATHWSGTTEFMTPESAYLLDYELVDVHTADPGQSHYLGHRWANPSEAHLRQLMRRVQQNPDEARAKGEAGRAHVLKHFAPEIVAAKITARLTEISHSLETPSLKPAPGHLVRPKPALPADTTEALGVDWEGSFLDFGSLSHVNRELTSSLSNKPGIQLACINRNALNAPVPQALSNLAQTLKTKPSKNVQVTVRHAWPPKWQRPSKGLWVVIQPWEFGSLPSDWAAAAAHVDEFWAYSDYVRRVYVDSGVDPTKVKVVPLGVDPNRFRPEAPPLSLPTAKTFRFLFVGGTIGRKGPDILLQSYLAAFTAADDVCLVIKDFGGQSFYAGQTIEAQIKAAQSRPNAPEILYLNQELKPEDVPGLYTACHCLVHPYRGEGFGLPVLEAMACGLPVVVTGGGSTDDFADDAHAYRIPSVRRRIGTEVGGMKLVQSGWLLEPSSKHLEERLRWIHAHRAEAAEKGRQASAFARSEWTWDRSATIAADRLRDLVERSSLAAESLKSAKPSLPTPPAAARIGCISEVPSLLHHGELVPAWIATCEAIGARPFHPEAWLMLGEIAQAAGQPQLADQCLKRARTLAPDWNQVRQPAKKNQPRNRPHISLPPWPDSIVRSLDEPRLTVCVITRNEEQFLAQCLKSVRPVADQLIVVDTGSTDQTCAIAEAHGAELHHFPWCDDFSAARNAALEHARGDWILSIDADEELPPEQHPTLRALLRNKSVMAWRLPIEDAGHEEEGCSYVPRLFRNAPGLHFVGRIHEQVFSSLEPRRRRWGLQNRLGEAKLRHHGYSKELTAQRGKVERNLRLLGQALRENPGDPGLLMSHGLELVRSGRLEDGLRQYGAALDVVLGKPGGDVTPEVRETLLQQYSTHLLAAKRFQEVIEILTSPIARQEPGLTASHHFTLGLALMEQQRFSDAADHLRQCLAKRNRPCLSPINTEILRAGPRHCLARALARSGDAPGAMHEFQLALQEYPKSVPLYLDYAEFLNSQGQGVEALQTLNTLTLQSPDLPAVWKLGGSIALSRREFLEVAVNWTAEAVRHHPEDPALLSQRAQALLLAGHPDQAIPIWTQLATPQQTAALAGLVLCQTIGDGPIDPVPTPVAAAVTHEFFRWYRLLLEFGAEDSIRRVNARTSALSLALPQAAQFLQGILAQAANPTPA